MGEMRFRVRLPFRRSLFGEFVRSSTEQGWLSKSLGRRGLVLWAVGTAGVIYAVNRQMYHLPVSLAPVCTVFATPNQVNPGQVVNLRWTAVNGTDFEIQPDLGKVAASGAGMVKPAKSVTYKLMANGATGTAACSADVAVTTPSCTLTADQTTIDLGQSATLSWNTSLVTDSVLEPNLGKVDATGSRAVTPNETTTYSLKVSGPSGEGSCQIGIKVTNLCAQIADAFFDVNSSTLRAQDQQTLSDDAAFLKAHPELMVTIEGHADERGTANQNFGLSNRRAEQVKTFLIAKGVSRDRIATLPHSDTSDCAEHDEACWQKNRRARFVCRNK